MEKIETLFSVKVSTRFLLKFSAKSLFFSASIHINFLIFFIYYFVFFQMTAYPVKSQELSDIVKNEDTVEQEPFLRIETEDSSESPTTLSHEDENITGARKRG